MDNENQQNQQNIQVNFPELTEEKVIKLIGDGIARGLYSVFTIMIIIGCGYWMYGYFFNDISIDATDLSEEVRSGMLLHIDYETGCHYLSKRDSNSLIERKLPNGKHYCEERGINKRF